MDVEEYIKNLVNKYGLKLSDLNLEITESALAENANKLKQIVKNLQNDGFVIEMDDFGSGYSSLNTLKDLSVDVLKIDLKFLEKSDDAKRSELILNFVIGLAKNLEVEMIAEGVESENQLKQINQLGCKDIQGYYYSKPIPFNDFVTFSDNFMKEENK